jgi:alanine racemase
MENFRQTYAEINLENLLHNWALVRKLGGSDRFICPMVKANAYGHGAYEVASVLEKESAKYFGVCLIEEGLALREAGLKSDILVFGGFDKQGAEKILEYQMTPVIGSWDQLKAIESLADSPVKVHVKFETGMNRLGFSRNEAQKVADYFKKSKSLKLKAILTHLACGEDSGKSEGMTGRQLQILSELKSFFKPFDIFTHALNSGGILGLQECSSDSILKKENWGFRPGLMLYGYQPSGMQLKAELKPAMSFRSSIHLQRLIQENETVSYGATWKAKKPSHIGVIPAGYADGIKRHLSNTGEVILAGKRLPIVGIVCMDFFMVDLTSLVESTGKENWLHEEVLLFGEDTLGNQISANEWAEKTQSISWEILTSVSERVPRHYKGLTQS